MFFSDVYVSFIKVGLLLHRTFVPEIHLKAYKDILRYFKSVIEF